MLILLTSANISVSYLLKAADTLAIDGVPGDHHHHGQGGLHQRQGAVLQLPSQDTLAVDTNNV